jgi:oxygen-independent coproporphyrinogen-3 oxidase
MIRAATEQAKGAADARPLGLYVHVPFCASTCDFCAFYQIEPTATAVESFLAGVEAEAGLVDWPGPVTTAFWGGGTPGLLSPRDLARLAEVVRAPAGGAPAEWTVELAPASVTPDRLAVLRAAGVTRISMGVQSFQPARLEALGRRHTREQVYRAYERVRAADFANVNLDLMFALPGQRPEEWEADLAEAIALAPEHLSTYCLTFEEDTALWARLAAGQVKLDPDREARFYEMTWARLAAAGFEQYEIANFARPGRACRHNQNTWGMHEWVGLGPAAASQHGGWRGANVADLGQWADGLIRGERMTRDRTRLAPALLAEDALIFGLRTNAGVDLAAWRRRCPDAPWDEAEGRLAGLEEEGLVRREGAIYRLTGRGRLLADGVGAELVGSFTAPASAPPPAAAGRSGGAPGTAGAPSGPRGRGPATST